ncbi:efflux RND transporter periplasmic adaptor subunit [Vitiosangium sp. GDMCC 1.1324]|uniref:efflux RND transporter periplasmic adaptor subunit n=1 Tax=Vitiosangium sp. (strain GDMCC 1.1324) TaxID=2138576 RepID=UPI00130DD265|nr:efflux RND transporter periplasmic adaptor subunit [Vitiosangium sp. GDMCC 1.1324]
MTRESTSPSARLRPPSAPGARTEVTLAFALVLAAVSCTQAPAAEAPANAPPPVSVSVVRVEQQPIEDFSDYLATLTSRRAVVLYPQVSGYVRSIVAKPGTPVKAGTLLLQVDSSAEAASLQNLVATRESLVASAAFAKDQLERSQALRRDGIVSQQDFDQARSQADQAEASLRAADALIASQKARLSFFNIVAPIDGVVGNVPVKVGDFVTQATPLTSVTQDSGLEADVQVPVERAAALGPGSKVRLIGLDGKTLAESPVVFISPRTDPSTQLVLIKAAFNSLQGLRADQMVRARVVFSTAPGLAIPTRAVTRQAGQTFAFVVDPKNNVARRLAVNLGSLQGNTYVVKAGLDGGQTVVVSGLQMLTDGATVQWVEQKQD